MNKGINLFRAEWQKAMGNVRAVTFLIWIYPITAVIFVLFVNGLAILFSDYSRESVLTNPPLWTDRLLDVWASFNSSPGNIFMRMPLIAFAAVVFAGEYQWGTWKNIIPRSRRISLAFAKFAVLGLLIIIALTLTSLIWGGGGWINTAMVGVPYGPSVSGKVIAEFSQAYLLNMVVTLASTLIVAMYAALFAMVSRSILASLMLSVGIGIAETASSLLLMLAGQISGRPQLINLYAITPAYNLDNISSWINDGVGTAMGLPGFTAVLSLPQSVLIIGVWMAGLMALTAVLFQRQDITS